MGLPIAEHRARRLSLIASIAVLAGALIGLLVSDGSSDPSSSGLLDRLTLPSWQPPDAVFGPVWTVLYLMIAASIVIAFRSTTTERRRVVESYAINIALNLSWTPLFFGIESPTLAGIEIIALLASTIWLIRAMAPVSRLAAALLLPYCAWVSFAAILNWTIVILNA